MVLNNLRRGIFVSTAKRYTRGSLKAADHDVAQSLAVDQLELWDFGKLIDMYQLANVPDNYRPWLELEAYKEYDNLRPIY